MSRAVKLGGLLPTSLPSGEGPPEYAVARARGELEGGTGVAEEGHDTWALGVLGLWLFTGEGLLEKEATAKEVGCGALIVIVRFMLFLVYCCLLFAGSSNGAV